MMGSRRVERAGRADREPVPPTHVSALSLKRTYQVLRSGSRRAADFCVSVLSPLQPKHRQVDNGPKTAEISVQLCVTIVFVVLGPVYIHGRGAGLARLVQFRGVKRKDMQRIFDEERRETGPIRPNPRQTGCFRFGSLPKKTNREKPRFGETRRISPLDTPMKRLKWRTLRRASCLAGNKMRHASAATMNVNRP